MNAEFFDALDELEREKGISKQSMEEKITQALISAYKKDKNLSGDEGKSVVVLMDDEKKKIEMFLRLEVVEEVEDPDTQILLEAARAYSKRARVGGFVEIPIETKKFGRIAAQAAKQVIIQGIREAERENIYNEFNSRQEEMLTGTVSRIEPRKGAILVKINSNHEYTEALLPPGEQIKSEHYVEGDLIKVFVSGVKESPKGYQVLVSRTHPGLVRRMFELEVPEIFDSIVKICSVAREAGSRTKIAVSSDDPDVDPIGACVGPKGSRVENIVEELGGEKIDIVKYSEDPAEYVAAALAPAEALSVTELEENRSYRVVVPDGQLSLAIGREGQNVRLAAKLTGFKIDIKSESEIEDLLSEEYEASQAPEAPEAPEEAGEAQEEPPEAPEEPADTREEQ